MELAPSLLASSGRIPARGGCGVFGCWALLRKGVPRGCLPRLLCRAVAGDCLWASCARTALRPCCGARRRADVRKGSCQNFRQLKAKQKTESCICFPCFLAAFLLFPGKSRGIRKTVCCRFAFSWMADLGNRKPVSVFFFLFFSFWAYPSAGKHPLLPNLCGRSRIREMSR